MQEATPAFIPPQTRVHGAGPESSGTVPPPDHVGAVTIDFSAKGGDPDTDILANPLPNKEPLKYPTLGSNLNQLVVSVEEGRAKAQDAAEGAAVYEDGSVAVTIHLTSNVDQVLLFLEDNSGDPRNVGKDYIEAYVPVSLLGPVSEQPGVIRVREIVPPQAEQAMPVSPP